MSLQMQHLTILRAPLYNCVAEKLSACKVEEYGSSKSFSGESKLLDLCVWPHRPQLPYKRPDSTQRSGWESGGLQTRLPQAQCFVGFPVNGLQSEGRPTALLEKSPEALPRCERRTLIHSCQQIVHGLAHSNSTVAPLLGPRKRISCSSNMSGDRSQAQASFGSGPALESIKMTPPGPKLRA